MGSKKIIPPRGFTVQIVDVKKSDNYKKISLLQENNNSYNKTRALESSHTKN